MSALFGGTADAAVLGGDLFGGTCVGSGGAHFGKDLFGGGFISSAAATTSAAEGHYVDGSVNFEFQALSVDQRLSEIEAKLAAGLQDASVEICDNEQATRGAEMIVKTLIMTQRPRSGQGLRFGGGGVWWGRRAVRSG